MRLSAFIIDNLESILQSWEDFARTIPGEASSMGVEALRDHAEEVLRVVAADLRTKQSAAQQIDKSMGKAEKDDGET
ncbi:TPA: sensor histidine kinase, partial [Pseudomonas aeruginosa]|nr:sensor histidine kinase [Pseudomonas aeruginosa]